MQVGLGKHIAHVSPHVAHVCATLRLELPLPLPQGHAKMRRDVVGHARNVAGKGNDSTSLPLSACASSSR